MLADAALARYAEAAQIWQELGDAWGESAMCQNRAIVLELLNRYDEALPLLERSVELARKAGDQMHIAQTVVDLAKLLLLSRVDDPRIAPLMREGLELCGALGERRQIIECLEVLAVLSARMGAPETGAELIGAAAAERERAGAQGMLDERSIFDAAVHELEEALGQDGFARARDRGHEWSLTEAIEAGLSATER
ncbi:MAG: tetratricopeptide repeat protein [Solirubrobacteraceae bacterium]